MVDALRKARALVRSDGLVIDIRPTPDPATVDVIAGGQTMRAGLLMEASNGQEYIEAERAMAEAIARGWFVLETERTFVFERHAATVHELVDHIAERWGDQAWLDPVTIARCGQARHARGAEARVVLAELVGIHRLRPA